MPVARRFPVRLAAGSTPTDSTNSGRHHNTGLDRVRQKCRAQDMQATGTSVGTIAGSPADVKCEPISETFESRRRSPPHRLGAVALTPSERPDSGPAGRPDPAWVLGGAGSEVGRTCRELWHELALGDHFWPRRPLRSPWPPASSGRVPKSRGRARPHAAQPRGSQPGFPVGDGYTWSLLFSIPQV